MTKFVFIIMTMTLTAAGCKSGMDRPIDEPIGGRAGMDIRQYRDFQLIGRLEGHNDRLWSLDAADGGIFASAGRGQVVLWNAETMKPEAVDFSGKGLMEDVKILNNGDLLSLGHDNILRRFRPAEGLTETLSDRRMKRFALSADEKMIAGSAYGILSLYSFPGFRLKWTAELPLDCFEMVFSPDGRSLFTTGHEGSVLQWSARNGGTVNAFEGLAGDVHCVDISSDGFYLAAGSTDCRVKIWDTRTGEAVATVAHNDGLYDIDISEDGMIIASAGSDCKVKISELQTGRPIKTLRHSDEVHAVAVDPEGRYIVSGGYDRDVYLWSLPRIDLSSLEIIRPDNSESVAELRTVSAHDAVSFDIAISSDDKLIATAGRDNRVCLWDSGTFESLKVLEPERNIVSLEFTSRGDRLLCRGEMGSMVVYDTRTGEALFDSLDSGMTICSFDLSGNDKYLLTGGLNGEISILDFATMELLKENRFEDHPIMNVRFSPDEELILFAYAGRTENFTLTALNRDLELMYATEGHRGYNYHTAFSAKRNLVATSGADALIKLWDLDDGALVRTLDKHRYKVMDSSFSSDEDVLVSGSAHDRTVRLWDVESGQLLKTLNPGTEVQCVEFSHDGRFIISSGEDGVLRFWGISRRV